MHYKVFANHRQRYIVFTHCQLWICDRVKHRICKNQRAVNNKIYAIANPLAANNGLFLHIKVNQIIIFILIYLSSLSNWLHLFIFTSVFFSVYITNKCKVQFSTCCRKTQITIININIFLCNTLWIYKLFTKYTYEADRLYKIHNLKSQNLTIKQIKNVVL